MRKIFNLDKWPRNRCPLKTFLIKNLAALFFTGIEPMMLEGLMRNISVKLFLKVVLKEMFFKDLI